jgi:hypothetical protein
VPHEEAEDAELLPVIGRTFGSSDAVAPMSRAHAEMGRLTRRLETHLDALDGGAWLTSECRQDLLACHFGATRPTGAAFPSGRRELLRARRRVEPRARLHRTRHAQHRRRGHHATRVVSPGPGPLDPCGRTFSTCLCRRGGPTLGDEHPDRRGGHRMTVATAVPRPPDPERGLDAREPIPRLLRDLRTSARGLSSHEAAHRLEQFGPNALHKKPPPGAARDRGPRSPIPSLWCCSWWRCSPGWRACRRQPGRFAPSSCSAPSSPIIRIWQQRPLVPIDDFRPPEAGARPGYAVFGTFVPATSAARRCRAGADPGSVTLPGRDRASGDRDLRGGHGRIYRR